MKSVTYLLYDIATSAMVPPGLLWVLLRKRCRPLFERFSPACPRDLPAQPVWVQACSIGEVATALPIVRAMRQRHPDIPVVLTASTVTGHERAVAASNECSGVSPAWFPFDHKYIVRNFIERLRPRGLVLVETELWPNVLRQCRRSGVPVTIINGRISDKHFRRYLRFKRFVKPLFEQITAAGVQNGEYEKRFAALGAEPQKIRITGNTKFDCVRSHIPPEEQRALCNETGLDPERPIVVFGSTRPGDEALAAQCLQSLKKDFPGLQLVVAPRHLERMHDVLACFTGERAIRRSQKEPIGKKTDTGAAAVVVVDTLGELLRFYSLATAAVVGGSFYPGVNGHNPLEPAALGIPTLFGPYMRNFIDPAAVLLRHDGAIQVRKPEALAPALHGLLNNADERAAMAERARNAVTSQRGTIQRNLDLVDEFIPF